MTPSFNADPKQAAHIEGGPLAALLNAIPGTIQSLAPDQHLTMEGSRRRTVIGVISGTLRSFRMTPDGRRHITRFVDAGGLIGLGALNAFRTSTEAVTVSRIVSFKASALEAVMERDAGIRDAVIQSLTNELVARDRIQFRLGRLWSDERVADFLLERASAGETPHDHSVTLQMSRADIADHLGVTIETISRALSRFQRDGLLRMTDAHHFIIVRRRALAALAEGDGVHATQHARSAPLETAP